MFHDFHTIPPPKKSHLSPPVLEGRIFGPQSFELFLFPSWGTTKKTNKQPLGANQWLKWLAINWMMNQIFTEMVGNHQTSIHFERKVGLGVPGRHFEFLLRKITFWCRQIFFGGGGGETSPDHQFLFESKFWILRESETWRIFWYLSTILEICSENFELCGYWWSRRVQILPSLSIAGVTSSSLLLTKDLMNHGVLNVMLWQAHILWRRHSALVRRPQRGLSPWPLGKWSATKQQWWSGPSPVLNGTGLIVLLGGGFKYFLFSSLPGEMIQFDIIWLWIFFKWVETTNFNGTGLIVLPFVWFEKMNIKEKHHGLKATATPMEVRFWASITGVYDSLKRAKDYDNHSNQVYYIIVSIFFWWC